MNAKKLRNYLDNVALVIASVAALYPARNLYAAKRTRTRLRRKKRASQ